VIFARGVGAANLESHTPNTTHTRFEIASITKQFMAVLVLEQVEEGRLSLDDKLSARLPWYRQDTGGRITIEQLLHHTSGLPPGFDTPEFSQSIAASRHYEPEVFARKFSLCPNRVRSGTTAIAVTFWPDSFSSASLENGLATC
jgi:CubicO group peptidase (beta-lactamase class C family)